MPFMGKDWRSPGEAWVKTESLGWQRMKLIEAQLHPGSCQSAHLACSSWPPNREFGQHMEKHFQPPDEQSDRPQRDASPSTKNYNRSFCESTSSSDGCSSRADSESPSLNSSPEKGVNLPSVIVSSPYGQYSCCAYHFESTPGSPKSSRLNITKENHPYLSMTRSLSRDSVGGNTSDERVSPCSSHLRYNWSLFNRANLEVGSNNDAALSSDDNSDAELAKVQKDNFKLIDKPAVMNRCMRSVNSDSVIAKPCLSQSKQNGNNQTSCCFYCKQSQLQSCQPNTSFVKTAPHCRISVKTREVAMYNTISEAFYRLDFCNAIHDIRRFNYICKLLHLLITQNLTSLSGCATKVLFTMLEQVAWEVSSNKRNIHVLKNLLEELKLMLQKYYCWGRPIGSSLLWQQHFDTLDRISQIVDGIELSPPKDETGKGVTFNNLPVEMVREILLRLNDYRDLINSAHASPMMRSMINEQYIWKKLCRYHFTKEQVKVVLETHNSYLNGKHETRNSRGIKYARTTSADGQISYRNPTTRHKNKSNITQQSQKEMAPPQRTSSERPYKNSSTKDQDSATLSHVTRAIRIFDKEGSRCSPTTRGTRIDDNDGQSQKRGRQRATVGSQPETSTNKENLELGGRPDFSPSSDIDWERVFHQLRKKFDLKEEYADCLLLCRHCRCLFWKSFGHPCIKAGEEQRRAAHLGGSREDRARSRLSVAALSRSFDGRNREANRSVWENENVAPHSGPASRSNDHGIVAGRLASLQHYGLGNLQAQLRARNEQVGTRRESAGNANNAAGNEAVRPRARAVNRNDELVPKHVAISPQAFLKFFSL